MSNLIKPRVHYFSLVFSYQVNPKKIKTILLFELKFLFFIKVSKKSNFIKLKWHLEVSAPHLLQVLSADQPLVPHLSQAHLEPVLRLEDLEQRPLPLLLAPPQLASEQPPPDLGRQR
jgi:hypothetical protein